MTNSENVNIDLNIGGVRIPLSVDKTKLTAIRETEQELRDLYDTWRSRFSSSITTQQLFAMMAYQYASHFRELKERYQAASNVAASLEFTLDSLLAKSGNNDNSDSSV